MPGAHTDGMARACGAITTVVNQTTTFVKGRLWAVIGDPNSHGAGGLIPTGNTVFVEGKRVIVNTPDSASADNLCIPFNGAHCAPLTAQGSMFNFAYGSGGEGPPIEEPQPGVVNLHAADLVVGSPQLSVPEISGPGVLLPADLAAGSPVLGSPVYSLNINELAAAVLAVSAPVLEPTLLSGEGALLAAALVIGAPELGSAIADVGEKTLLPTSLEAGAPLLTAPSLGSSEGAAVVSVIGGFAIGSQVIAGAGVGEGIPEAGIDHLYAAPFATASAESAASQMGGIVYECLATALQSGSPVLAVPPLGGTGILTGNELVVASPQFEAPTMASEHALSGTALETSAPQLGSAELVTGMDEGMTAIGSFVVGGQKVG